MSKIGGATNPDESEYGKVGPKIVTAIAEAEGVHHTELDFLLHEIVDLDALERLIKHSPPAAKVIIELEIEEYTVHIRGDGTVGLKDGY